ncbi:MAG: mechanosensitive ion channel family protein [Oscillospiraceae bacterium]|jgi:small-conductance mechanosensitive channel|nr:mechanosensitive ion channel family protein [Oscillospiraceae bacterium]
MDKFLEFFSADKASVLYFIIRIAALLLATVILTRLVRRLFLRLEKNSAINGKHLGYLRLAKYVLYIIIYIAAIGGAVSGSLKTTLSALLASSGVAAVVLSIACQEPISNLCSGIIIILSRPFQIGDVIRYLDKDISGTVEEITLRHTVIRTFENKRLIIPNGVMNKSVIENANFAGDKLCMPLEFCVTYESDLERAMSLIRDVIMRHPDYDEVKANEAIAKGEEPVEVFANRLEDSGVVLRVWVWAASLSVSIRLKSDILLGVRKRFAESGVHFAYPHMELVGRKEE